MEAGRTRTRDIFLLRQSRDQCRASWLVDVILHWHLGERERSSNQSLLDAFFEPCTMEVDTNELFFQTLL